jgi:hypothetical protein
MLSTRNKIDWFYSKLKCIIVKQRLKVTRAYNVHETGLSAVQTTDHIIAPKGTEQVGDMTSWKRDMNVTFCFQHCRTLYPTSVYICLRQKEDVFGNLKKTYILVMCSTFMRMAG